MKKIESLTATQVFLVLAILGGLIYSNTFSSGFVFDDLFMIPGNSTIHHLTDFSGLWRAFNTRFIVGLSLALNYALGKEGVVGYHAFNTLVHILNAFLVYQLICLTPKTSKLMAFLAALVFLTHPVQTQAVTYIWQRSTSLATFFYIGSLVFYIRGRLQASYRNHAICLLFAVLGMFTKEIVFTLPFAIALYEFIFLKEIPLKMKQKMLLWIPLALTLFIIPWGMTQTSAETLSILRPTNTELRHQGNLVENILEMTRAVPSNEMSRKDFLLTELNVLRTYLRLFFFPVNQSIDYDYPMARSLLEPNTSLSLLLLIGLVGSAVFLLKKYPLLSFAILWFFLTVSVESLVAQKYFIFEHRMYLPMMGLSLFLVAGLHDLIKNQKRLAWVVLGIAACLSLMTFQRNALWKDEFTLWNDTIQKFPDKGRAYNMRAHAYAENGRLDEAIADYTKAIQLEPRLAQSYNSRGSLYNRKGQPDRALVDINRAIELGPKLTEAYNNRGAIYKNKGLFDLALKDFNKTIELDPRFAKPYNNRASVYGMTGRVEQALADCERAIKLDPTLAQAYSNRGALYKINGLFDKALIDFNRSIQLQSDNAEAYNNRASLNEKKGLLDQALHDGDRAVELNPKFAEAYNNRGYIHRRKGRLDLAVRDFDKAIELKPDLVAAYNNRGSAYVYQGRLDLALLDFNKAIELDPTLADTYNNRGTVYGMKNLLSEALLDFNKALKLRPDYADAYSNRAHLYFLIKDYDQCQKDIAKAQSLGFVVSPKFIEQLKNASSKE